MAVSAFLYGSFLQKALNKEIDFDSDNIYVMLLTNAYTPNQDTHDYLDDVVANEVTGTGYTANGAQLLHSGNGGTATAIAYTSGTNVIKLDFDDTTWASSTITARYAVVYDRTPATDATRPLIGYVDFGSDQSSSAGNFVITWSVSGVATITVS